MNDGRSPHPITIPPSDDEAQRLAALHAYEVLDTPPEPAFERITALAARLFRVPMCLVVLADAHRLWFKSAYGVNVSEIPRATTFCAHAILADEVLVVTDPSLDARFADCFLVTDAPHARFYAGAPLRTASGHHLGTLCLMDTRPRKLDAGARQLLRDLAAVTMDELELRREIIRRQRAEAELARDHERLRLLESVVVHANDAILITEAEPVDEPGPRILYANRAFERMSGHTQAEVLGRTPRFLCGVNTSPEARATIRRALKRWEPVNVELLNYRKDGSEFWVDLSIYPVADERGWFTHWVSVQRDVTGRRLAEEAMRHSEARNAAVLQTALDAIITVDGEGRVIEFNPAAESMFGFRRAEAVGHLLHELIIPLELRERHLRGMANYLATGVTTVMGRRIEMPALRADGSRILVELAITRIPIGGPPLFTAYLRDVTEARRTEQALRESQARYERVTANVPGMVYQFVLRRDGSTVFPLVSEGCREIYGVESGAAQRDPSLLLDLVPSGERESFARSIRESADTLQPWCWEGVIQPHDGSSPRHIQISSRPARLANGDTAWDGLVMDVTARRQAEALQRAKTEADRANAAKSEFLSRMSHELRTPLNAILGFGQLLKLAELGPREEDSVDHILRAGRHLLSLVDEVLDIARIEAGRLALAPEPMEVGPFLREAAALVSPLRARLDVTLLVEDPPPGGPPEGVWVKADRNRLKQILLNLLANAIKHNRSGGQVILGTGAGDSGWVRLTVRDNGPGIAPEQLARLFTPFERLGAEARAVEGTGLGLTVCKRLADAMGIPLGVESTPGEGSVFWVDLPRAEADEADADETDANVHGLSPTGADPTGLKPGPPSGRLLYIEDNPSNLSLVANVIARLRPGWQLLAATDGASGLKLAATEPLDLILLDRQLPDLNGEQVLARLQADPHSAAVPVVILSADASQAVREGLLAAGARAYLTKPLEIPALLRALDAAIPQPRSLA